MPLQIARNSTVFHYKVKYTDPSFWTGLIFRRLNYQSPLYIYLVGYDFIISFTSQSSKSIRRFRFPLSVCGSNEICVLTVCLADFFRTSWWWVAAVLNGINLCASE